MAPHFTPRHSAPLRATPRHSASAGEHRIATIYPVTVADFDAEITQEAPERRRFVVCGDDSLAYRLAEELANRHHGDVTVIVQSRTSRYGTLITRLPGVHVLEADRAHPEAFAEVDLATVDALALVESNDVANIDAALAAHEINPSLRMVVRMFNSSLGAGVAELPYCTVVSDGALAAPAFVAAALGDVTSIVSIRNDTMHVALRRDLPANASLVCGLALAEGHIQPELIPADQDRADIVLMHADRSRPSSSPRAARLTHRYPIRVLLARIWRRIRVVLASFLALLLLTAAVLAVLSPSVGWWRALHTTVLVALGTADIDQRAPAIEQLVLTFLTVASFLLIPFLVGAVVDAVVKARLDLAEGTVTRRASGHFVVVGLGAVGTNVIQLLYDEGIDVVAIDKSPDARGVQLARKLDMPLIIGDATRQETLLAASVPDCRGLLVVTSQDVTNLETALIARAIPRTADGPLHVVLRLFDGEFAARIQRTFHLATSRSVSYLAVPSFAARMLGGQVVDTIAVDRRVLLVAELTIGPYSRLASGGVVGDLRRPGEAWLLALITTHGKRLPATVTSGRRLHPGEQVLVVCTRLGLARLIADSTPPPEWEPRPPLVLHDAPLLQPNQKRRPR
jgi:Trk K+ transport system NAD-binding subunit